MADSLNATEIAVGSLLANGNGVWNGNRGSNERCHDNCYANPSANAVRIDRNADVSNLSFVAQRDLSESNFRGLYASFDTATRAGEAARIEKAISDLDQRNADQRFQTELRTNDRLLALQAEMNENAREAAKCCCDLKFQIAENKAEMTATILGVESRNIERALNAANAELTALKTQLACGCHCPPVS